MRSGRRGRHAPGLYYKVGSKSMGKRELVLVAIFVAIGTVAYRLMAPASTGPGFSLSRLLGHVRHELKGDIHEVRLARVANAAVPDEVTRARLRVPRGELTVTGTETNEVSVEVEGVMFGPDAEAAASAAEDVRLEAIPHGENIDVRVALPEMRRRPRLEIRVQVPSRLAVSLDTEGEIEVSGVNGLELSRGSARVIASRLTGPLTGRSKGGSIEADKLPGIELETSRTELRLSNVEGPVKLKIEQGNLLLERADGRAELDLERVDADLEGISGPIEVRGRGGRLRLRDVEAPVEIEGERMELIIGLEAPVPVHASTTGDLLELTLPDGGVTLDLRARKGKIRARAVDAQVESHEDEEWLKTSVKGGGPLIKLENTNGDIVVR
jgi:hypothetical protein